MNAIVQDTYGGPEVLSLRDLPRPRPGRGEVLLRVRAAAVSSGDWHLMTGLPYPVRLAYGLSRPRHRVPGLDVAGVVEEVGPEVSALGPGDEVLGTGTGAFAEYARVSASTLVRKPAALDFARAAVLPGAGLTALQGLRDRAELRAGQSLLILGAAGGVGTFAVQIARALGAEVTGACRTAKQALVRALGAHHVIDYTREDPTDGRRRYDAILDLGGNRPLSQLRRALAPRGTLVIVGGEGGGKWLGGMGRQLAAQLLSPLVRQRLRSMLMATRVADLRELTRLVETGALVPTLDRTFPLAELPEAMRYAASGRACGKIAITP